MWPKRRFFILPRCTRGGPRIFPRRDHLETEFTTSSRNLRPRDFDMHVRVRCASAAPFVHFDLKNAAGNRRERVCSALGSGELRRSISVISLIVPCWKDHDSALAFAETWAPHPLIREIIIAGVQNDLRPKDFNGKIKRCVADRPGRGLQMNLGAQLATGEVLLFHHVDSILTEAHLQSLANAI